MVTPKAKKQSSLTGWISVHHRHKHPKFGTIGSGPTKAAKFNDFLSDIEEDDGVEVVKVVKSGTPAQKNQPLIGKSSLVTPLTATTENGGEMKKIDVSWDSDVDSQDGDDDPFEPHYNGVPWCRDQFCLDVVTHRRARTHTHTHSLTYTQ